MILNDYVNYVMKLGEKKMTEKRFYIKCDEYNAWSVHEKDKDVVVFDLLKYDAEIICNLLNEQHEEIKRLKLELDTHRHPLWSTRQAEAKVKELVDNLCRCD